MGKPRTPEDILRDSVISAMETGNFAAARLALAASDLSEDVLANIRREILRDYAVSLH